MESKYGSLTYLLTSGINLMAQNLLRFSKLLEFQKIYFWFGWQVSNY